MEIWLRFGSHHHELRHFPPSEVLLHVWYRKDWSNVASRNLANTKYPWYFPVLSLNAFSLTVFISLTLIPNFPRACILFHNYLPSPILVCQMLHPTDPKSDLTMWLYLGIYLLYKEKQVRQDHRCIICS